MKNLVLIIFAAVLLNACDEKDVRLYPSFEESVVYTIDSDGSFEEEESISSFDILDAVADLDQEGEIEDVTTEGIWIVVKPLSKNTASSVKMDVSIGLGDENKVLLLDDYTFNVPSETKTFYVSSSLLKLGVNALTGHFRSIIVNGMSSGDINFEIEGMTTPNDSKINMEVEIFVKQGVVIKQTIQTI